MPRNNKVYPASAPTSVQNFEVSSEPDVNQNVPQPRPGVIQKLGLESRTVSTQYLQSDFRTEELATGQLASTESGASSIAQNSEISHVSRSSKFFNRSKFRTLYQGSRRPAESQESSWTDIGDYGYRSEDDEDSSIDEDDISVDEDIDDNHNLLGCGGPSSTSSSSKNYIIVSDIDCQTDWWLGVTNEAHPAFLTYNANSAYNVLDHLRDHSDYLGHRVVKLEELQPALRSPKALTYLRVYLIVLSCLLIISGAIFFIAISRIVRYTLYLETQLYRRLGTLVIVILGTLHPILCGVYCLYAVHHLDLLRPYYLRTTVCLVFPLSLFITLVWIHARIRGKFPSDFYVLMKNYDTNDFAHDVWDSTQTEFECCGLHGPKDWKWIVSDYPKSCCRHKEVGAHCDLVSDIWETGCLEKLQNIHLQAFMSLATVAVFQFTVEAVSICLTKAFNDMIKHKLFYKSSALKILFGPMASLCESTRNDEIDPRRIVKYPLSESEDESETETEPKKGTEIV